jgi:putative acetyltransferase
VNIRPETPADYEAITQITYDAFKGKPYSDETEHWVVLRLREAKALALSLVAEVDGRVVGHVAFSVVLINGKDVGWYGLGPISVMPTLQNQSIGSKLIHEGLSIMSERGARGCVLEGSPAYYHRFGFRSYPQLTYAGAPAPEYFMAVPFYETVPAGTVEFHTAFYTSPNG